MIKDFRERIIKAKEDNEETAKIIKAFEPLIKKCVRMYIRDLSSFEDGLQEGRIAILNCIRKYDITSTVPFEGYLKKVVIYTIRNFALKYKENASLDGEVTEDGGSFHEILDSGVDIEGDEIEKERLHSLKAALDKLSESERKIIDEFYFKGETMREMCKGRRCHYMTVVKHKEKALEKLKKVMGE